MDDNVVRDAIMRREKLYKIELGTIILVRNSFELEQLNKFVNKIHFDNDVDKNGWSLFLEMTKFNKNTGIDLIRWERSEYDPRSAEDMRGVYRRINVDAFINEYEHKTKQPVNETVLNVEKPKLKWYQKFFNLFK